MKQAEVNREPLWNVKQAAAYLGISHHTLYAMVSQRRVPYAKVGGRTIFNPRALDEWIAKNTVKPVQKHD